MSNIGQILLNNKNRSTIVATHDGNFHLDELVSIYLIDIARQHYDGVDKPLVIVRTRNSKEWDSSDLLVDVGMKYDGVSYFDHHQDEINVSNKAAVQLVWDDVKSPVANVLLERYGTEYENYWRNNPKVKDAVIEEIQEILISPVSEWDIGNIAYDSSVITLQNVVKSISRSGNGTTMDDRFIEAYSYVMNTLHYVIKDAIIRVLVYIKTKWDMDCQTGDICILESRGPWYAISQENSEYKRFKLVIYPTESGQGWYIKTMNGNSKNTYRAPAQWRGIDRKTLHIGGKEYEITYIHETGQFGCIRGNLQDAKSFAKQWILAISRRGYQNTMGKVI